MGDLEMIFARLGMEPTTNKREIKRAYAKKTKQCHPEEWPEEWKQLHEAYQAALIYADSGQEKAGNSGEWKERWDQMPEEKPRRQNSHNMQKTEESDHSLFEEPEEEKSYMRSEESGEEKDCSKSEGTEEEEYQDLFEKMKDQAEVRKLRERDWVLKRLGEFMRQCDSQSMEAWKVFFESSEWKNCCEEEIVLNYLIHTLGEISFSRDIVIFLMKNLEELKQRLNHSARFYEAGLVEKSQEQIRLKNKYDKDFQGIFKEEKKKKRKSLWVAAALVFLCAVAAGVWIKVRSHESSISEYEAKKEIAVYLNQKYPQIQITEEKMELSERKVYSYEQRRSIRVGYYGTAGKDIQVCILTWKDAQGGEKILCFDDYQSEQVKKDMETELLKNLGTREGSVHLSANGDSRISELLGISSACYHTRYEGDLTEFFRQEADNRSRLKNGIGQMKPEPGLAADLNLNGRCVVYLKDEGAETIAERLENQDSSRFAILEQVLKPKAEAWNLQMEGVVFPGEYYKKLMDTAGQDEYLKTYALDVGGNTYHSNEPPFAGPLVSAWYQSKDQKYEGKLYIQQVKKLADGIYWMNSEEKAEVREDVSDVLEFWEPMREEDLKLNETILPEATEAFLKANGISNKKTKNYKISGDGRKAVLIFDKESLGFPEKYRVILTEPKTEDSLFECTELEISHKVRDQADSFHREGIDESGYLMLVFYVGESDVVTIADR